jgi:hypothetical protein
MKKAVLREYLKERDEKGNRICILSMPKPEIIPFDEGGFTIDENGDIEHIRVKPKKKKKADK